MKNRIVFLVCLLLILLFSYTATSKWIDFQTFTVEMHNQPLPRWLSNLLIVLLPVLEIGIVVMILVERTRTIGLLSSLGLMFFFTGYTALVLLGVFHWVPCSCGGIIKQLSWKQQLVFNLFFDGLIILAIIRQEPINKLT